MSQYDVVTGAGVLAEADARVLWEYLDGFDHRRFRKYYVEPVPGPPLVVLARDEDGEPIGMAALHRRTLLVDGAPVEAGVAGDFVVVPAHRTLGLAMRIQRELLDVAREYELELVLGQPNETARAVLLRLGYRAVAQRERAVRVVGRGEPEGAHRRSVVRGMQVLDAVLGALGPERRLRRSGEVAWLERFDERFEDVLGSLASRARVVSRRSPAELNWRYELDGPEPGGRFRLLASLRGAGVDAYLVVERIGSIWRVLELHGDPHAQAVVCAEALAQARASDSTGLVIPLFAVTDEQAKVLRRLHLVRRPSDDWLVLREVSGSLPPWASDTTGWSLTAGDLDV